MPSIRFLIRWDFDAVSSLAHVLIVVLIVAFAYAFFHQTDSNLIFKIEIFWIKNYSDCWLIKMKNLIHSKIMFFFQNPNFLMNKITKMIEKNINFSDPFSVLIKVDDWLFSSLSSVGKRRAFPRLLRMLYPHLIESGPLRRQQIPFSVSQFTASKASANGPIENKNRGLHLLCQLFPEWSVSRLGAVWDRLSPAYLDNQLTESEEEKAETNTNDAIFPGVTCSLD